MSHPHNLVETFDQIDSWARKEMDRIAADAAQRCGTMTTPIYGDSFEADQNGAISHEVDTSPGAMC